MTDDEHEFRVRPGRIRQDARGSKRLRSFIGEVTRAARAAGHTGKTFGSRSRAGRSTFGRGRRAAMALSRSSRRVAVKARVVRHGGAKIRAASLVLHLAYLSRDGVTRDGQDARLFDARSEAADERAFAGRCEDDRHHFRFIVSPEDAAQLENLRTFTRELMADAERDLGTRLDWVAVDHWNTDNPHVHVLVRGRADDGEDLVISRDYISRGLRGRAEARVSLELGPKSELEIASALRAEVEAERWTGLDRTLRVLADENAGIVDLRPGSVGDAPETRSLLLGRAGKLERLGLAARVAPACWTLTPELEPTLRALADRNDVIRTMHKALARNGNDPDVGAFALQGDHPSDPVLGRLAARGLDDELKGTAYAIIEGVDGRSHHLRFASLEMTGDGEVGAIVEARAYADASDRRRLALAVRSDLALQAQVPAQGATWLDRQLLAREPAIAEMGFGSEVRDALARRAKHLEAAGTRAPTRPAVGLPQGPAGHPAGTGVCFSREASGRGHGPSASTSRRGRARGGRLPRASDPRFGTVGHDRRRTRVPARALATGPGAAPRAAGERRHGPERRCGLELRAAARRRAIASDVCARGSGALTPPRLGLSRGFRGG